MEGVAEIDQSLTREDRPDGMGNGKSPNTGIKQSNGL
jgi:hypothetical protein